MRNTYDLTSYSIIKIAPNANLKYKWNQLAIKIKIRYELSGLLSVIA